jgi:hypothetical protein
MLAGFDQVNRAISGLRDALAELNSGSRGIATLAKRLEKLQVPGATLDSFRDMLGVTRQLGEAERRLAEDAQSAARAWRELAEASRQVRVPGAGVPGGPGGGHGRGGHVTALDAAMGAQMAGNAGMGLLERGFTDYAEVQLNTAMAQSDQRVTDAVMNRANSLIAALQKQYPALTQAEGLTLFRNSMGIFGDADEALKALPGAARLQQLYQLAPLGRGGSGGSEVQAAEKAGDALQAFINPQTGKLDTSLYQSWMDFQARSYQAGGGLVDAKNWLAFARTSRSAGIGLSPRALEEAQALLEMSPGRTGTALMSAFQVFGASTSHMTDKNRDAWKSAGLLTKSGDIIDRALYQSDPFEWVWRDMLPALKAKGIETRDQILRWLTDNGQRGTVSGLLADIAVGQTPIRKTATKMEAQDPALVEKLVNTDVGKLAALHAAETNFFVALGKFGEGPGLALLTSLTNALNKLTEEANTHPEAAKNIIVIGGGLALISKVLGDAAMAAIFVGGPLVKGLAGLSGVLVRFAVGGEAEIALATLAGTGAGSLAAVGVAALGLVGAAVVAAQSVFKIPKDVHTAIQGAYPDPAAMTAAQTRALHLFYNDTPMARSMQHSGDVTVHTTNVINLDSKTIARNMTTQTLRAGQAVQSGTTQFDGRMQQYPAGAPAGGGN